MSYKNVFWLTRKNKMKHEFCINEMKWEQYISVVFPLFGNTKGFKKMDCWKLEEINRKGEKELTNNAMKDRRQRVAFWVLGE